MYAVVTGGGTSGHVVPAMAIIEMLQDAGHPAEDIAYVGSRRGVESSVVPALGVRCEFLPVSGLQRSLSLRSLVRNAALPARLVRSTLRARRLVAQWSPRVVVSVGGYASEPMARAAVAAGVPLVCVSYDRVPGLATRRQARFATVSAVAFGDSSLPRAVVTGAPVRRAFRVLDIVAERTRVRASMGAGEEELVITVVGGSLGSAALNDAVDEVARSLATAGIRAHVHHVTGPRFAVADPDARTEVGSVTVQKVAHESDMPGVLAASDIVVSRAGASTVAEIATVGVASVLVPWSGAAGDHQTLNARWLADAGGALMVDERVDLRGGLVRTVSSLANDPGLRSRVSATARELGGPNRASALVEVIGNAASA